MATPLTICPFCQSRHVMPMTVEGVHGQVTVFRCEDCARTWSEIVSLPRRATPKAPA